MPTWLGFLLVFKLLFGGRRGRRHFGRSLFFGGLLGWLAHRNFNMDEVQADLHSAGRNIRRNVRRAVKAAKHEFREAGRAARDQAWQRTDRHAGAAPGEAAARGAEQAQRQAAPESAAEPVREILPAAATETHAAPVLDYNPNEELVAELERNARTAAMAADVPTLHFPEEAAEKYNASGKYLYNLD